MANFFINGFTDSHTQCDRCGRSELKGTFNITTEQGDTFHLGSSCIKKGYQMTQKELTNKVEVDYQKRKGQAREKYAQTVECENVVNHYKTDKNGESQFSIDREISLDYAMRFALAARPVRDAIATEFNLRGWHEI